MTFDPLKIKPKAFAAAKRARLAGSFSLSANDNYNLQQWGLTYAQYRAIARCGESMFGSGPDWADNLTLPMLRQWLGGKKLVGCYVQDEHLQALAAAFP